MKYIPIKACGECRHCEPASYCELTGKEVDPETIHIGCPLDDLPDISELEIIIGKLGDACNKIANKYSIIQPLFNIFKNHGKIINKCIDKIKQ